MENIPTLFVTFGFPGSGKTYFSKRLAKDLGAFHLNSDRLRSEIFPSKLYSPEDNKTVFGVMDYIAEELLSRSMSVLYDANVTKRIFRKRLQKIAKKAEANYLVLWIQVPLELALKRVRDRTKLTTELQRKYEVPIDEETVLRLKSQMEDPVGEANIILDGTKTYKSQRKLIQNFLNT